jgi:molybdenum cofactor biosynthesis enzyme MoaA
MRCEYCPTAGPGSYGENFEVSEVPLEVDQVVWTANELGPLGFEVFRLTGGEPLLDIRRAVGILRGVVEGGWFSNVRLNTNGSRLLEAVPSLKGVGITRIKVSLDTLDAKLFQKISRSRKFDRVIQGIEAASRAGLPVEVNAVLTLETSRGLVHLIDWCQGRGLDLKILDLVSYDSQVEGYSSEAAADARAIDQMLTSRFGEPTVLQLSGGRGILMKRYGSRPYVLFKDCHSGTTYTSYCSGCPHYPCEEGIHHLALSTDGNLRPCRIRNNVYWALRPFIERRDADGIRRLVREILTRLYGGVFLAKRGERIVHGV